MPATPGAKYGSWTLVPVKDILVSPNRGRKTFAHVKALVDSIRKVGLLHPIVVTKQPDGKYHLNAGECRLQAVGLIGWTEIPVTFWENLSPYAQKEIELEENLNRADLHWTEQVETMRQLDELQREMFGSAMRGKVVDDPDQQGWTMKKLAEMMGQGQTQVQDKVRFAKLLKERPELKAQVEHLPLTVALRKAAQIQEGERVARMHAGGLLKLSTSLLLGDCRELIKQVPADSVDLILTDPPFGISVLDDQVGEERGSVQSYTALLKPADNATAKEVHALFLALAPEFRRVLRPGGHFYVFFSMDLYEIIKQTLAMSGLVPNPVPLVWYKSQTTAPFRGYDYAPCYEPILFGHRPPRTRRLTAPCKTVLDEFPIDRSAMKIHPFQKPQGLLCYLIKQSTQLGQTVLDPFAGSGATVVAARATGRTGLGFEIDEGHFNQAQARLLKETDNGNGQEEAEAQTSQDVE